jgi:hypothetical protein
VHEHALRHKRERILIGPNSEASAFQVGRLLDIRIGLDETKFLAKHAASEEGNRLKPVDSMAARGEIRAHGKFAGVVLAVVVKPFVADAALHRYQVQVDPLGLDFTLPQRLQVIIVVNRQRKSQSRHNSS